MSVYEMRAIQRKLDEQHDYAQRISKIMKQYDKEDYCDLHYDWHSIWFMDTYEEDKAENIYVVVAALLAVYNGIKNDKAPDFSDIEHEEYTYDAYDEIDFDDYEEYLEYNFEETGTRVRVKSAEDIQRKFADLTESKLEHVKRLFHEYNNKLIVYGLVNRIEYMLQVKKGVGYES